MTDSFAVVRKGGCFFLYTFSEYLFINCKSCDTIGRYRLHHSLRKGKEYMSFPNAAKGIKRIYVAEILKLFAYICLAITAVAAAVALSSTEDGGASGLSESLSLGAFILAVITGLAYVVLMIIAFIFNLTGYIKARSDNENFKTALVFLIVGIAFSVLSTFVINKGIGSILYSLSTLSDTLATIFVIAGVMQIAFQIGREDINQKGKTVLKLIIAVECITFVLSFISTFFRGNTTSAISAVLMIASLLVSFIKYILYLSFLSKSKKLLAEHQ